MVASLTPPTAGPASLGRSHNRDLCSQTTRPQPPTFDKEYCIGILHSPSSPSRVIRWIGREYCVARHLGRTGTHRATCKNSGVESCRFSRPNEAQPWKGGGVRSSKTGFGPDRLFDLDDVFVHALSFDNVHSISSGYSIKRFTHGSDTRMDG